MSTLRICTKIKLLILAKEELVCIWHRGFKFPERRERSSKFIVGLWHWTGMPVVTSLWSTGTFCHVIHRSHTCTCHKQWTPPPFFVSLITFSTCAKLEAWDLNTVIIIIKTQWWNLKPLCKIMLMMMARTIENGDLHLGCNLTIWRSAAVQNFFPLIIHNTPLPIGLNLSAYFSSCTNALTKLQSFTSILQWQKIIGWVRLLFLSLTKCLSTWAKKLYI